MVVVTSARDGGPHTLHPARQPDDARVGARHLRCPPSSSWGRGQRVDQVCHLLLPARPCRPSQPDQRASVLHALLAMAARMCSKRRAQCESDALVEVSWPECCEPILLYGKQLELPAWWSCRRHASEARCRDDGAGGEGGGEIGKP
jgi:hypothetical protein